MSDFNYGRSMGFGSHQDSQHSSYGYLARERCMQERPGYGRNLETSEDYRYSNPPNNYRPQRIPEHQNNGNLQFNQNFANERTIDSRQPAIPSNYSRDVRSSNIRDFPERNYYNPSEPTGDNSYAGIPHVSSNNTFTNQMNSFQPSYDNHATSGATRYIPPPPVPPVHDNQTSHAATRYIPPPPAPPPIPDFSRFTDQDMSLMRNIIQNINTAKPTPAPTTYNPPSAQSTSFSGDDRVTSNIPRFSRDNTVDEYAPIISSSKKTPVTFLRIGNTTSGNKSLVSKPLMSTTFFNSGMSEIALLAAQYKSSTNTTSGQDAPHDSRSDRAFNNKPDSLTRPRENISDRAPDNRPDRAPNSRSDRAPNRSDRAPNRSDRAPNRSDRAPNSRTDRKRDSRSDRSHDSRSDRSHDSRSDRSRNSKPGIVPRPKKFEKKKGMPNQKRPNKRPLGKRSKDEVPSKRKKEEPKPKKSRGNDEDYDDGWNDIRKEKIKFKKLFPIQAQKIYALMLRRETPIDIPETIKDAPKEDSSNLQEEERLDQEFHQRQETFRRVAEERTAKKREKRRRRRENKRQFVKNSLDMK